MNLDVAVETWPMTGVFRLSRGSKSEARVVVVTLHDGPFTGRGECVPYARYGETVDGVVAAIRAAGQALGPGANLAGLLPRGAARNALDCALWDLAAKRAGRRAWHLAGMAEPEPVTTCFTLGLDTAGAMAEAAGLAAARFPLLKLKLGTDDDLPRLEAVRRAAPAARLVVDANEGWNARQLERLMPHLAALGVELVEQPLPTREDAALAVIEPVVPLCADESFHDRGDVAAMAGRYQAVNVKLDKTGGLTEALATARAAREAGLAVMVGCMVGTSLAMAPAMLLAAFATWVDLDGPLLLARDRDPGLPVTGARLGPPPAALWG